MGWSILLFIVVLAMSSMNISFFIHTMKLILGCPKHSIAFSNQTVARLF